MLTATDGSSLVAGQLIVSQDRIPADTRVDTVYDFFSNTPYLEAMAVTSGERPVGLITRSKLLFMLSRRFGFDLYARNPIIEVADTAPLVVCETDIIDSIVDLAFSRSTQEIYDEIVVISADGAFRGLLSVKQLVIEQSNALARSTMLKELACARTEELERLSQVKSQFLAHVTHELRSPVNALVGLAQLLKMAADQESMTLVRERLSFLLLTAANLRTVINNILDLSKIEAGKMEVVFQEVDLVPFLAEMVETTRILVGQKPVRVELIAPDALLLTTDPMKLRQIITNLVTNAAKFTDQGTITVALQERQDAIAIDVSDTGIGIREEDLSVLCTPFAQVEQAATKSREGTGLGLAISKNLAHLIGGSISINSSYGNGSTFALSLPFPQPTT